MLRMGEAGHHGINVLPGKVEQGVVKVQKMIQQATDKLLKMIQGGGAKGG